MKQLIDNEGQTIEVNDYIYNCLKECYKSGDYSALVHTDKNHIILLKENF